MNPDSPYPRYQQTIETHAIVKGFGYWSGEDVWIEFRPAAAGTGLAFVRPHRGSQVRIPVNVAFRQEVPRRTNLVKQGASVEMVEHVIAALAGLQIDNCEIWASAPEMPGGDGSSQAFVDAILKAGIMKQSERQPTIKVKQTIRVGTEDAWIEARPVPEGDSPAMTLQYSLDYGENHVIQRQDFAMALNPATFQSQVAGARTFVLKSEADQMQANGIGWRVSNQDLIVFGENGPIDNPLRYPDECVRHKTLDMVGDLALCGCDLIGVFQGYRTGHRLNAELVRQIIARHDIQQPLSTCA
ncbi:MAG: UDP-3-O-acyl-N-acetylglucosamine deacetylase [Planctomycetota bacterium]|nr:UDP-3-O-acyl-N-acetylglucosamine deacetylase [Planctomycetota bacterium]